MKALTLTKEHKSKLLEICKTLFPEYTIIQFGNQSNYYLESEEILDFYNDKENFLIHWFEFCMTHLSYKLQKELNKVVKDNERISLYHRNDPIFHTYGKDILYLHPVDYLYEEFKKLKF